MHLDALLGKPPVLLGCVRVTRGEVGAQDAVPRQVGTVGSQHVPDEPGRAFPRRARHVAIARHPPARDRCDGGSDALVPFLVHDAIVASAAPDGFCHL